MTTTTVLVAGAYAHVGANTVSSLLARGHDVVSMVRRTSGLRGHDTHLRSTSRGVDDALEIWVRFVDAIADGVTPVFVVTISNNASL